MSSARTWVHVYKTAKIMHLNVNTVMMPAWGLSLCIGFYGNSSRHQRPLYNTWHTLHAVPVGVMKTAYSWGPYINQLAQLLSSFFHYHTCMASGDEQWSWAAGKWARDRTLRGNNRAPIVRYSVTSFTCATTGPFTDNISVIGLHYTYSHAEGRKSDPI